MNGNPVRLPAEWEPQEWLWIGFPHDPAEWGDALARAQEEIAGFANAVAESGQDVRLLVSDAANEARAKALVSGAVRLERRAYGDVWLRDTGPIVVRRDGGRCAVRPSFNGWGGKYPMAGDESIGAELAQDAGLALARPDWVLEGGAIDWDGTGLIVTTRQCVLNPNRNGFVGEKEIERRLLTDLGCDRVLWLENGLVNDHTDGHVDNLARFVAENRLAIPEPSDNDPNWHVYQAAARAAEAFGVEVVRLPSPGRVHNRNGEVVPASHMNFYIGNAAVVVPLYGQPSDSRAVIEIEKLFPGREVVGIRADHVLTGGGSFHCISQQIPAR